jgi:hypothetical protein
MILTSSLDPKNYSPSMQSFSGIPVYEIFREYALLYLRVMIDPNYTSELAHQLTRVSATAPAIVAVTNREQVLFLVSK